MPKRIQRKRTAGWRMPEGAVYVGRPTRWGNPYVVGGNPRRGFTSVPNDAAMAVRWFGEDVAILLKSQPDALAPLRGKDLACWCRIGEPCHADVLLKAANE